MDRQGNTKSHSLHFQHNTKPVNFLLSLCCNSCYTVADTSACILQLPSCRHLLPGASVIATVSAGLPQPPVRKCLQKSIFTFGPSPGLSSPTASPTILMRSQQWERGSLCPLVKKTKTDMAAWPTQ